MYRWRGPESTAYLSADCVETIAIQVALGLFIAESATPENPYWFLYIAHLAIGTSHPNLNPRTVVALLITPAWVMTWLVLSGGPIARIVIAALALAAASLVMVAFANLQSRLHDLLFERNRLSQRLLALEVKAERGRIARELHDGLSADLSAIAWRIDILAKEESPSAAAKLAAVSQRARAAIDDAKSVVWSLRGDAVPFAALAESIGSRCRALCSGRVELQLSFSDLAEEKLAADFALNALRIVQESVRNALRHAQATLIQVMVNSTSEALEIDIMDDGLGIYSTEAATSSRTTGGLHNLRRRVQDFRGELHVTGLRPGSKRPGTRVHIRFPQRNPD